MTTCHGVLASALKRRATGDRAPHQCHQRQAKREDNLISCRCPGKAQLFGHDKLVGRLSDFRVQLQLRDGWGWGIDQGGHVPFFDGTRPIVGLPQLSLGDSRVPRDANTRVRTVTTACAVAPPQVPTSRCPAIASRTARALSLHQRCRRFAVVLDPETLKPNRS